MVWGFRRPAARVVLLDKEKQIFLVKGSDPMRPEKGTWWEIPGGGIESGEKSEDAARRELYEECGFENVTIGPCIWTQYVEFDFAMYHFKSDERIHLAEIEKRTAWDPKGLEALEAAAFEEGRWWSLDDLLASEEQTLPERLREFLPQIVAGDLPLSPIDISPIGGPRPTD